MTHFHSVLTQFPNLFNNCFYLAIASDMSNIFFQSSSNCNDSEGSIVQ